MNLRVNRIRIGVHAPCTLAWLLLGMLVAISPALAQPAFPTEGPPPYPGLGERTDTNAAAEASSAVPSAMARPAVPSDFGDIPLLTNELVGSATITNKVPPTDAQLLARLQEHLDTARKMRRDGHPREAEPALVELLDNKSPEPIQQSALLELALAAQDEKEWPRAQQIYAQFVSRWPNTSMLPEIMLRQGRLFRQMGLNSLALAKFYSVMTTALALKKNTLDYYQRLVLLAQTDIAETHYQLGKYAEAADFLLRLLKQNDPALNRCSTQFRLVRALSALGRDDETVTQARDFLLHFANTPECPEVRFHTALALKRLGRNNEATQQVLTLLKEQKQLSSEHPELWAYWQQRAGNEIANQLYRDGDYASALEIYLDVAQLDARPEWQMPVAYQVGLAYERMAQPEKALKNYQTILQREAELGAKASPGLKTIIEMARWRIGFLQWQVQAESSAQAAKAPPTMPAAKPSTSKPGNP